jgi:hypothetical protein
MKEVAMMRAILGVFGVVVVGMTASAAVGQVVIEGPRYQYGRYNEVYYGGRNPVFTGNNYVYLPRGLQVPYAARRLDTPWFINSWTQTGGQFVSPYTPESQISQPVGQTYIFTDYLPFVEVGQFGYTVDQARNEAYANVPRLQTGVVMPQAGVAPGVVTGTVGPAGAPMEVADGSGSAGGNAPAKAIPLLNWAKAERTRNPALFRALIQEARKYDAAAAANVEAGQ